MSNLSETLPGMLSLVKISFFPGYNRSYILYELKAALLLRSLFGQSLHNWTCDNVKGQNNRCIKKYRERK